MTKYNQYTNVKSKSKRKEQITKLIRLTRKKGDIKGKALIADPKL